jgi:hypothetical protein
MRSQGKISVSFLYHGDRIILCSDGQLTQTSSRICEAKESPSDADQFMRTVKSIPKGSILEISQIYVKARRKDSGNYITVSVVDGPVKNLYMRHVVDKEIAALRTEIVERDRKSSGLPPVAKKESLSVIKNMRKKLYTLETNRQRPGFTKLLKISMADIELWDVQLAPDKE